MDGITLSPPRDTPRGQRGVGMLETLIAILVVTFGIIAYMELLAFGLKHTDSAAYQNQASVLASHIVERMRSNLAEAGSGAYDIAHGGSVAGAETRAGADLGSWQQRVAAALPGGSGSVSCSGNPTICVVGIRWDDSRVDTGGSNRELILRALVQ